MNSEITHTDYLDCYIRVSTTQQKTDGHSLEVQEHLGLSIAEKLGLTLRLRNEGSQSSTIGYRDVLEELKEDISKGRVKNIWTQDRSRMFRDQIEGLMFRRDYLEKHKVTLYEGETPTKVDFSNIQDKMVYDLITRLQQYDNELRTEKFQRGKLHRLKLHSTDKPVYLGGTPLFGYTNKDKLWKIDRPSAKWVRWIFDAYEKGMTTKQIKDHLDKEGVPPARTKSGLWNLGTLQKMLRNQSYTGLHTIHIKKLEQTFTYKVPKIIPVGQFNRVQLLLTKNLKNHSNNKRHFSLLEDLLVCECGSHIGSQEKNTTSSLGYAVNTRKYYCVSKNYDWKDGQGRDCLNKMRLQMDRTNEYVLDRVVELVGKSDVLKSKFRTDVLDDVFGKRKDLKETEKRLERKTERLQLDMETIENNIAELEVDVGLGKRDRGLVDKIIKKYADELTIRKTEYEKTEKELDDLGQERSWVNWVERYGEKLELDTSNETKQRDFLRGVLDKIVVKSEYGYGRDKTKKIQRGHTLDFHYKLKVVDDGFEWTDKTTSPWSSVTVEGEKIDKSPMVRLVSPRKKKVKKIEGEDGIVLFHQSKSLRNGGVGLSPDG